MSASLRALLTSIVDYAGLYPPAGLPMEAAIRNYFAYRAGPLSWMLGRFVCSVARLRELTPFLAEGPPLRISALGRGGRDNGEFLAGLREDLEAIDRFRADQRGRVHIDVLETRPATVEGIGAAHQLLAAHLGNSLTPFYEVGFAGAWRDAVAATLSALSSAGCKLRCGGIEASAFPAPGQVAFVVTECRSRRLALKATAGLHHPLRRFDATVRTTMHGFINLFAGGVLAHVHTLSAGRLQEILEDEDASHFTFDDEGLSWRELRATTAAVASIRANSLISFGSCSFEEPCADLRALGWL